MEINRIILPLVAGGALAWMVYQLSSWMLGMLTGSEKALLDFKSAGAGSISQPEVRIGSETHQLRLAFAGFGLDVTGWERTARCLAWGGVSLGLVLPMILVGFPALIWLVGPALGWVIVGSLIRGKWNKVRNQMEKEIPLLLTRLSGSLQTSPGVIDALNEEAENLEPGGPLQAWVFRLVQNMQAEGVGALQEMQEEAKDVSPALLLVVVEIERLFETGGQGYAQAFRVTAENLAGILETRAEAFATAEGAWGTVRLIALALGGAVASILLNRSISLGDNPLVQMAVLLAIAWAGAGWWYIGDMIQQATQ
jgi:hypothetical protein